MDIASAVAALGPVARSWLMISNTAALDARGWPATGLNHTNVSDQLQRLSLFLVLSLVDITYVISFDPA